MNIQSLLTKIDLFEDLIIQSGFRRDVPDFIDAINQPQNRSLLFMRDIVSRLKHYFNIFESNSLDSELMAILKDTEPFTNFFLIDELDALDEDPSITADGYFEKLNIFLQNLLNYLTRNIDELELTKDFLLKYAPVQTDLEETNQAMMSLVFKDFQSTSSLKEFSKVLNRWNRTLLIYHTILKSESPKEISLVEIQNGSIDVIFNLDFDIALDFTELVKAGLKAYGAYLLYKSKLAKEIIASYTGNKKLLDLEQKREVLMLENIKEAISTTALEQHNRHLKIDKSIDKAGLDKKITEVSNVLADHIIKGNEVKLLTVGNAFDESDVSSIETARELREETAQVKRQFKKLDPKDQQLLIDKYSLKEEAETDN